MSKIPYIKKPKFLFTDPIWKSLSLEYRHIFETILAYCVFEKTDVNDHGHIFKLEPGQMLTTLRDLVRLCDEPNIKKSKVERALRVFKRVGLSGQEVRHHKTIITITEPRICELIKNESETRFGTGFGTRSGQDRDRNKNIRIEELKKDKENIQKKVPPTFSPLATALLAEFHFSLSSAIPNFNADKLKATQAELSAMEKLLRVHGEVKVRQVLQFAHKSEFWRAHVHTAVYLQKKFETLVVQMTNPHDKLRSKEVDRRTLDRHGNPVKTKLDGVF